MQEQFEEKEERHYFCDVQKSISTKDSTSLVPISAGLIFHSSNFKEGILGKENIFGMD